MSTTNTRSYNVILDSEFATFQTVQLDPNNIEASLEPVFKYLRDNEDKFKLLVTFDTLKQFILKDATTYITWPDHLAACKRSVGDRRWKLVYWFDRNNTPAV